MADGRDNAMPHSPKRANGASAAGPRHPREIVAENFGRFLRENFSGPYQVARAFYVDDRTAEYWWQGRHVPNGVIVCLAHGMYPESAERHLRLVIDNPQPVERPLPRVVPPAGKKSA